MTQRHRISLRAALADPELLGSTLSDESWRTWRVLLIAAMGESLSASEREVFKQITGREREPLQRVEELAAVVGRRGGKSRAISTLAAYIGGLCEHPTLVPGETGIVLCIAPDQRQATITLDYCTAAFSASPILRQLIASRTADTLTLTNGISIEVRAASFRRLRGPTYIAVIADEAAFWPTDESANPDSEILSACRPGLATTNGLLVIISSPYARRGELWSLYSRHYGPNGDPAILVAQGDSRTFNPTLARSVVDRAYGRDPISAGAEYGAQFRTDIESFVSIEAVSQCIDYGTLERGPVSGLSFSAFVDPSGGSSDSMTLAIGHNDFASQTIVLDLLREAVPPFSPEATVEDFARTLKAYGISRAVGDRYAGIWPVSEFARFGITYEQNAAPKSDLYRDLLPLINSRRVALLDHKKLVTQLVGLERRTARSGKDSIDHAPGAHDDVANAVAGVVAQVNRYGGYDVEYKGFASNADDQPVDAWREQRRRRYFDELMGRYGRPGSVALPWVQQQ
jgi:hypothetical protein